MTRTFRLLVVIGVTVASGVSAAGASAAPQTSTFTPAADSYVSAKEATKNFGTKDEIKADVDPLLRGFLRFDVQGVSGTVTNATLRLYSRKNSTVGFDLRDVPNDAWGETTITHNNAPAPSSTVTGSSGPHGSNVYVSVDVTSLVQANGLASFAVTNTNTNELKFTSREKEATKRPQLVVEWEPVPTPPSNTSPPTISGQPHVGQTLTGNRGTWTGTQPISYADQWLRCDAGGAGCVDIPGATATMYLVTAADLGSTLRFQVTATNSQGSSMATSAATAVVTDPPPSPVIAAAGDIACNSSTAGSTTCRHRFTSDLLVNQGLSAVLPLGDIQYNNGELANFNAYYNPTWGRVKDITYPAPGNHEYYTAGATGYYSYFGARAGDPSKGYYSYDIGNWHMIALNSNCSAIGGCGTTSAQTQWLRNDLAAHPTACTLAYWHHPRFNSGAEYGNNSTYQPFWQALYDYDAEIVLGGHEHVYERFAPQTPTGAADPAGGIRHFTVGTGGRSHYGFGSTAANSQVRHSGTFGVLKLTLHPGSYDWQFVPEAGKTFTDTGSYACH